MDARTENASDEATETENPSLITRLRQRPLAVAAIVVVVIALVLGAVLWWLHARNYEATDDAFIDARSVAISAQVNGAITQVAVDDNQRVPQGAVLVTLDDRDYRVAVDQARAQIDQANASIANLDAQIDAQEAKVDQARKEVDQAKGAFDFARQENARYQDLLKTGAGTVQRAQQATSDLQQRAAAFTAAQANAVATDKQIEVLKTQRQSALGQLEQAQAAQAQAQTNLARTVIRAPVDGRVTKLTAAKGAYAQVGQALLMFVPHDVWVTANFKETQLALMRPGQPVEIRVDAFPERTFHGHIDSIQAGSGTAFSLLPPENATGNYVKVVQRVPVKIVFDQPPDVLLGPGMSVVPTVTVR